MNQKPHGYAPYWRNMFDSSEEDIVKDHQEMEKLGRKSRLKEAYEKAHNIRKFEIELYWKRATYFWGFESVIIAAYGGALSFSHEAHDITVKSLPLLVSLIGLIFTILWRFSLEGSKAWQENWEKHICILEECISGNLYKNVLLEKNQSFFSVSRINSFVAEFIILC